MRIGAHVDPTDPLADAAARKADVVQFFLTDPQGYKSPKPRADAAALRGSDDRRLHPRAVPAQRRDAQQPHPHPEPQAAAGSTPQAAAEIGAKGLIVHGGHVGAGDELDAGFDNWRKTFAYAAETAAASRRRS